MFKEQKTNIFVPSILAVLLISLSPTMTEAVVDIDWLALTTYKDHNDGTPITNPWGIDIWVYASNPGNLNYIEVTKPGVSAPFATMYETDNSGFWDFSAPDEYASLTDLRAVYPLGIYTLDFYDSSNNHLDSVSLYYSITDMPSMPVDFTNPSVNGQIISANPTFTWTVDPGAGDALMRVLEDVITDETFYADAPVSMTSTSWAPGPLIAGRQHELDVSVLEVQDWVGPDWPTTTTTGGDPFAYSLMNEYFNEINFLTIPATGDLSGLVWIPGPNIGYSLDEGDWLYFYHSVPVLAYNFTTGQWLLPEFRGLFYVDWPFWYEIDANTLWFTLPSVDGLWMYRLSTGQWVILPRIIP